MMQKTRASGVALSSGVLLALMAVVACDELSTDTSKVASAQLAEVQPSDEAVQPAGLVQELLQHDAEKRGR